MALFSYRSARSRTPSFEPLERRLVLFAASGYEWADPNVSFSFVPEGASLEGYSNTLFSKLDSIAPTEVWQREFARALQTWANSSNLNFHQVSDDGSPSGLSGDVQDNGRFGDIRLGAHPLDGPLAYAYSPVDYNDLGGDIVIDPGKNYQIGSGYDLYSVLLHEAGHAIGLGHAGGTVMNPNYQGILSGLTTDDIAGVQSIYGERNDDAFDSASRNDDFAAASSLTLSGDGSVVVTADLSSMSDLDFYEVVAPTGADGSLTVSADTAGLSLLAPRLSVFDATGALLGSQDVGYGENATLTLSGVTAGESFYVMADGATTDEFAMGAYRLGVDFGVGEAGGGDPDPTPDPSPEPTPDPSPETAADRYESNDSLATSTSLGRFNSKTVTDVTLHSGGDTDFFQFSARKSGTFQISAQMEGGSSLSLTVYDASGSVLTSSTDGSVSLFLSSGVETYLSIESPTGEIEAYDLAFEKIGSGGGGGGKPRGAKGGKLEPDMYFADEASHDLAEHIHSHDFVDDSSHSRSAATADAAFAAPFPRNFAGRSAQMVERTRTPGRAPTIAAQPFFPASTSSQVAQESPLEAPSRSASPQQSTSAHQQKEFLAVGLESSLLSDW